MVIPLIMPFAAALTPVVNSSMASAAYPMAIVFYTGVLRRRGVVEVGLVDLVLFVVYGFGCSLGFVLICSSALGVTASCTKAIASELILTMLSVPLRGSFGLCSFSRSGPEHSGTMIVFGS